LAGAETCIVLAISDRMRADPDGIEKEHPLAAVATAAISPAAWAGPMLIAPLVAAA